MRASSGRWHAGVRGAVVPVIAVRDRPHACSSDADVPRGAGVIVRARVGAAGHLRVRADAVLAAVASAGVAVVLARGAVRLPRARSAAVIRNAVTVIVEIVAADLEYGPAAAAGVLDAVVDHRIAVIVLPVAGLDESRPCARVVIVAIPLIRRVSILVRIRARWRQTPALAGSAGARVTEGAGVSVRARRSGCHGGVRAGPVVTDVERAWAAIVALRAACALAREPRLARTGLAVVAMGAHRRILNARSRRVAPLAADADVAPVVRADVLVGARGVAREPDAVPCLGNNIPRGAGYAVVARLPRNRPATIVDRAVAIIVEVVAANVVVLVVLRINQRIAVVAVGVAVPFRGRVRVGGVALTDGDGRGAASVLVHIDVERLAVRAVHVVMRPVAVVILLGRAVFGCCAARAGRGVELAVHAAKLATRLALCLATRGNRGAITLLSSLDDAIAADGVDTPAVRVGPVSLAVAVVVEPIPALLSAEDRMHLRVVVVAVAGDERRIDPEGAARAADVALLTVPILVDVQVVGGAARAVAVINIGVAVAVLIHPVPAGLSGCR